MFNNYNSLIMNNKVLIDNLRCIPDFPKKGINFRDVTTLYKNAECIKIMLDELEALYKDKGITKIVGIESRGFVMASALAGRLGCGVLLKSHSLRNMVSIPSRCTSTPSKKMTLC